MSSFPLPPPELIDHATDTTAQTVMDVAIGLGVLAVFVAAAHLGRRYRTFVPLAIALGSLASAVVEPLPDVVAGLWYYVPGQQTIYTAYGNPFPVWTFFSYTVFYGGLGLIFWRLAEAGLPRGRLLLICVPTAAYLAGAELFMINGLHLYTYYGPRAFVVAHFPVWIPLLNTTIVLGIGTTGAWLRRHLDGVDQLLAAFLLPSIAMVIGLLLIPGALWTVTHTAHPGRGLVHTATVLAILTALAVMRLTTRFLPAGGFPPITGLTHYQSGAPAASRAVPHEQHAQETRTVHS